MTIFRFLQLKEYLMTKILLIDDEKAFRDGMKQYLQTFGLVVDVAENGSIGWQRIGESQYDAVVTDVLMPGEDGFELLKKIKKFHPKLVVIVITGGGRVDPENYQYIAKALGATASLRKPFTGKELIDTIGQSLLSKCIQ